MGTLYIMVGIPGSGKTTAANMIDGTVVSADSIRKEYFGAAELQYTNEVLDQYNVPKDATYEDKKKTGDLFIYSVLNERIREILSMGKNCVYDATNVTRKRREPIVQQFKDLAEHIVCIFMEKALNLDLCLKRNRERSRFVPEEVIHNMFESLEIPQIEEGFDEILWINDHSVFSDTTTDRKKVSV